MQETKQGFFTSIKDIEKSNFYEYLSVMIDWGVTISEWLESLNNRVRNKFFLSKIRELKDLVNTWDNLSRAMKKMPDTFEDSEVAIIEAWENAWKLQQSLATLWENLKDRHELKKKIKGSLTYPLIILIFLVLAVSAVMIIVIPALMPIFADSKVELPAATRALISTSDFFKNNFIIILFLVVSSIFFTVWYKKTENWKAFFDNLFLKSPLIWEILKNYTIANISVNLWSLISWGIPITKAITLTWRATNSAPYIEAFENVREEISGWKKMVESMVSVDKEWKLFSPDFLQMLSVGEKTASMEKVCTKINKQYNREVQTSLDTLTKWVEPIAILIAWVFVLWFAFAVFWAILEVTRSI